MSTNYVSHMRASFFDDNEEPIHTVDGQFIAVHELHIICDGSIVAEYAAFRHKWYAQSAQIYATRVTFSYVDEQERTLPDN